jgi:hypothetical protein
MPDFHSLTGRTLLVILLFSACALAVADDDRIQKELAETGPVVPHLRKVLGDKAYDEAMASGQYRYIGELKCRLCHRDFFIGRKQDVHDYAFRNLITARYSDNPRCLVCHTTGYGTPEGFSTMEKTSRMANIQCEGCHGPGSKHMQKNAAGGFLAGKDNPEVLKKMCLSCHNQRWGRSFTDINAAYDFYKQAKPDIR